METMMLPITPDELAAIPRARATRVSYDWQGLRYSLWIADVAFYGLSVVTDYGVSGRVEVVTSPCTRGRCIEEIARYVRDRNSCPGLMVDEWECLSVRLDAWITWNLSL